MVIFLPPIIIMLRTKKWKAGVCFCYPFSGFVAFYIFSLLLSLIEECKEKAITIKCHEFYVQESKKKKFIDCGVSVSEILQCLVLQTSQTLYVKKNRNEKAAKWKIWDEIKKGLFVVPSFHFFIRIYRWKSGHVFLRHFNINSEVWFI